MLIHNQYPYMYTLIAAKHMIHGPYVKMALKKKTYIEWKLKLLDSKE